MRVLIQGAGALGSLLGYHLAEAGHEVTLGLRRRPDAWPRQDGSPVLSLFSPNSKNKKTVPIRLTWPERRDTPADLLLLTTKAQDAEEAARRAEPLLLPEGAAVLLSNGLGLERAVSARLSGRLFLRGLAYCGALLESPGGVRDTGAGRIVFGLWENEGQAASDAGGRLESILRTFREAGIAAEAAPRLDLALWGKAMANLAINPLGALARVRNGVVGTDPRLSALGKKILEEARAVAASEGVSIGREEAEEIFRSTAAATAENENSMLRDLLSGKRTEIDHLNGAVARRAKERGMAAPLNSALAAWVRSYHPGARS